MLMFLHNLCVLVCCGDGGQVGSAAVAGGSSRSRQGGAAQPAGGGEEVGGLTVPAACTSYCTYLLLAFTDVDPCSSTRCITDDLKVAIIFHMITCRGEPTQNNLQLLFAVRGFITCFISLFICPPCSPLILTALLSPFDRKVEDLQFRVEEDCITKGDLEVTRGYITRLSIKHLPLLSPACCLSLISFFMKSID